MTITRGQRLLLAVLQRTTASEVAARVGVGQPAVSRWASGLKTPSAPRREKLEQLYGIPRGAWDAAL
jgi:transcriptional regulator with XRE-family HTH domain